MRSFPFLFCSCLKLSCGTFISLPKKPCSIKFLPYLKCFGTVPSLEHQINASSACSESLQIQLVRHIDLAWTSDKNGKIWNRLFFKCATHHGHKHNYYNLTATILLRKITASLSKIKIQPTADVYSIIQYSINLICSDQHSMNRDRE